MADDTLRIVDDSLVETEFAHAVTRIVTLSPHATELVYAVGAGSRLVAVSEFSDFPEEALNLPTVSNGSGIDYEAIVAFQPDLVVAWLSGNGMAGIHRLRQLGIKVLATEPRDLDDIIRWLRVLGNITGNSEEGEAAASRFAAEIEDLRGRFGNSRHVDLMIEIGQDPLMTLSSAHIVSSLVELCGATHLFADLLPITPIVDIEAVYQLDPDIILQLLDDNTEPACEVDSFWKQHGVLKAVSENKVCGLPSSILSRHTTRLSEGARRLCELIDDARLGTPADRSARPG